MSITTILVQYLKARLGYAQAFPDLVELTDSKKHASLRLLR
jgi:hypothetical protein